MYAVKDFVVENYRGILTRIRDANVASLRQWGDRMKEFLGLWANDQEVQGKAKELYIWYRTSQPNQDALSAHELQVTLGEMLENIVVPKDHTSYRIMTRAGFVLASSDDNVVGMNTSAKGIAFLAPMLEGMPFVSKPFSRGEQLLERTVNVEEHRILVGMALAPPESGPPDLFLILRLNPEGDFTRILGRSPPGKTGDVYAIDDQGVMISESHRPVTDLQRVGLLSEGQDTCMDLRVSDPGVDLTQGEKDASAMELRPLTKMAAAAVAGTSGVDLDGYRDYRGVSVLGAWEWIDELGFGVAVEITEAEANQVLRPIQFSYGGLFLILVLATGGILFSYYRLIKLRMEVGEIQRLGQYTLVHKIGEGGMGEVYFARHALLRRPTAVKLIRPDREDKTLIKRFEREVQLTSTLTHPNTVAIYDFGVNDEGIFYYAMEYLPGIDLSKLTSIEGQVSTSRVVHILRQAASALSEAHKAGIIHRDIKPSNLILCERGGQQDMVKLLDFGLVKEFRKPSMSEVTGQDMVGGTPGYIPPERLKNPKHADPRTDIYALGVVAFNLLAGKPLFKASSIFDLANAILNEDPSRLSEHVSGIPEEVDDLVFDCCARDPQQRPATADALLERLVALKIAPWTQKDARDWWAKHMNLLVPPWEEGAEEELSDTMEMREPD